MSAIDEQRSGEKKRLALFVSGGGRSLENLFEEIEAGRLPAKIGLVLCNKQDAFALERARRREVPTCVLDPDRALSAPDFSHRAFRAAEEYGCGTVVLAGFMRILEIPESWNGRVLNIHPSLLPEFGGAGFYGMRVHRAVKEAGALTTGCTVHLVTNKVDGGPILLQRSVTVSESDSPEDIAARVFEEEKRALPEALRTYLKD